MRCYHRMHPTNLTRRRAEASKDEFLHIIKGMLDRRRSKGALLGLAKYLVWNRTKMLTRLMCYGAGRPRGGV